MVGMKFDRLNVHRPVVKPQRSNQRLQLLGGIVPCYGFFTAQRDEAVALKIPDE
jgi:hypothetical protein